MCVSVGVLCCGCFGVGFAPLSCLGAISVVGCWNTGVTNGVHATLLNNKCSRKWSSFVLQDASGPTDSTSLHELVT